MRTSPVIALNDTLRSVLTKWARAYTVSVCIQKRARIIIYAEEGLDNRTIAQKLSLHHNSVGLWRSRFASNLPRLLSISEESPEDLEPEMEIILLDRPRSGRPLQYDNTIRLRIKLIACQSPKDHGFELSHWSLDALRKAVIKVGIVKDISTGCIYDILIKSEIKPWKIRYYLHSKEKYEDYETYSKKIEAICTLYKEAPNLFDQDVLVYSTDEMTGIQALEDEHRRKGVIPGSCEKKEFNYIRHGTTSLIGFFNVQTGKLVDPYLNKTRTETDFVDALSRVIALNPEKEHAFVLDNLNIHQSESLVRYVAKLINYTGNLGEKGKSGILKSKESRADFLSDKTHRIRFYFVPIHCSWMNQIEIWFSVINRRLLKRTSYESVEILEESIRNYVRQYNEMYAHPYKWKYDSVPTQQNIDVEELVRASA